MALEDTPEGRSLIRAFSGHDDSLARLRAAMAGETPLESLSELAMGSGEYTWCAEGPDGRLWTIVWQPARETENMRAWPFPGGRTKHRGHAASVQEARREAVRIAGLIEDGKKG